METNNNTKHIYRPRPVGALIRKIAFIFSLAAMATAIIIGAYYTRKNASHDFSYSTKENGISRFSSKEQMQAYLNEAQSIQGGFGGFAQERSIALNAPEPASGFASLDVQEDVAQRVSQTNVQVMGIDEPDVVKADNKYIYLASEPQYYILEDTVMLRGETMPAPERLTQAVQIINAFPPENLEKVSEIKDGDELILKENILVTINRQTSAISAYDISDKQNPKELWSASFTDANFASVRLIENEIMVVSQKYINYQAPCPMPLLEIGGERTSIACDSIYHLTSLNPSETTYTALKINLQSGQISDTLTFLGSNQNTTVYVSSGATYVVLSNYLDHSTLMLEYFTDSNQSVLPAEVVGKIKNMMAYDISLQAKLVELQAILQNYKNTLTPDQVRELETNITNALANYINDNMRNLFKSEIVKIDNQRMNIAATKTIPGVPLNQFSLDEYNGNLRIATTVGQSFLPGVETENDVYVLNENLDQIGQVTGLGRDERIYSVRFMGELAYVVTFKEIDPFFVLDMSDPKNPSLKGELKIPGYSSYLHPLSDNLILGVGKEDQYVKLSLFDVANPQNPVEISSLLLDEFYSEILSNHHAFLADRDNQLVFIPGSRGGYVVSYENQDLKLQKAFDQTGTKRGLYLDQYFYLVASGQLRVFDIDNWEEVNQIDLN